MIYEPNNVYCADSYEAIKDIPDKSIDLIITDPPYDIPHTTGGGCSKRNVSAICSITLSRTI